MGKVGSDVLENDRPCQVSSANRSGVYKMKTAEVMAKYPNCYNDADF